MAACEVEGCTDDQWSKGLPGGYGTWTIDGHTFYVHRLAYELLVGPIPEGLHIDHLCNTRTCCNPLHLDPVTQAENNRRSWERRGRPETCKRGHPLAEAPVRNGSRHCRECASIRKAKWRAKNREVA